MNDSTLELINGTAEAKMGRVQEAVGAGYGEWKDRMANASREAKSAVTERLGAWKQGAADQMDRAADRLPHDRLSGGLHSAADYVRYKSASDAAGDIKKSMRAHPGAWLLGAAAVGIAIGLASRSTPRRRWR